MRLLARKRKSVYPSDLTDAQWALIEPVLKLSRLGRPVKHEMREIFNAILYVEKSGCQWRMLPREFPPYPTVNWWFNKLGREGQWQAIHDCLVCKSREKAGRAATPTAAVIDSQSVKAAQKGGLSNADMTPASE